MSCGSVVSGGMVNCSGVVVWWCGGVVSGGEWWCGGVVVALIVGCLLSGVWLMFVSVCVLCW